MTDPAIVALAVAVIERAIIDARRMQRLQEKKRSEGLTRHELAKLFRASLHDPIGFLSHPRSGGFARWANVAGLSAERLHERLAPEFGL